MILLLPTYSIRRVISSQNTAAWIGIGQHARDIV